MRWAKDAPAQVAAMLVVLAVVAACGGPEPSAQPSPQASTPVAKSPASQSPTSTAVPAATAGPTQVTDTQDGFRLVLTLPTTMVRASEPIAGEATLTATDGRETNVDGSGSGLIGFMYEEIGGTRAMGGSMTADCRPYTIPPGDGFRSTLSPSGGWTDQDPNADFYRSFAQGSDVRLPAGAWRITAFASFVGAGCTSPAHDLRASTVVVVEP